MGMVAPPGSHRSRGRAGICDGPLQHAPLTQRLVLVSDLAWSQSDIKGTTDIWLLETGIRAQLTSTLIGAIGIGAGLNRGPETPEFTLTAGFQIGLGS